MLRPNGKAGTVRGDREGGVQHDSYACYALYEVGGEPTFTDVTPCQQFYAEDHVSRADCTDGEHAEFKLFLSGDIVITRTYSAPDFFAPGQQKDSMVLSVGKCSVVVP